MPTAPPDKPNHKALFQKAQSLTDEGNFDEAIDTLLEGLRLAPQDIHAIQSLRDCSLRRKAAGHPDIGLLARLRTPRPASDLERFLKALKLLAYSPGDTDRMVAVMQTACKCGYEDVTKWAAAILKRAYSGQRRFTWP